ncbi:MAG: DUF2490 domain-containing protein [Chitinophagales bacterium]
MRIKHISAILLLIFSLFNAKSNAQQLTKTRDIGLWSGVGIEYEFRKNCEFSFAQDIRLFESFTKIDKANTEMGFSYTINKNFKLGTNARYSYNLKKEDYYSHDFRMNYDLQFKVKMAKNLKLRYRLRFQQVYENLFTIKRYKVGGREDNLRNRIQIDYEIENHQIYFNTELFRAIEKYRSPYFNKLRFTVGSKWENKLGKLNYAIAYERDLGEDHPLHYVFAKVYYTFEFEKKEKRKKKKDAK